MNIWSQILDALSFSIFFLSQAFGGNLGLAIITISLVARLAILPISIKAGRRMREQQEILESIQPKIKKIKARYKNNPGLAWGCHCHIPSSTRLGVTLVHP